MQACHSNSALLKEAVLEMLLIHRGRLQLTAVLEQMMDCRLGLILTIVNTKCVLVRLLKSMVATY